MLARMDVGGAFLPYADDGEGELVLFLHGALGDLGLWQRHRAALAGRFRTVAYTQRFFGDAPWRDDWPPFGVDTHARDLVRFLERLGGGPAHLVAWSYAGHVALVAALRDPKLFASLFVYEPGVPTYVTEPAALDELAADAQAMFGPLFAWAKSGGGPREGVRLLIDASAGHAGYFDAQPEQWRAMELANARTLPLQLEQQPPPVVTCEELRTLEPRACVAYGERTRALFRVVSEAAARCIPGCRRLVVPGTGHLWPLEAPEELAAAVADFLAAG